MSETTSNTSLAEYTALGFYHKATFLRSDTWIRLSRLTTRLSAELLTWR